MSNPEISYEEKRSMELSDRIEAALVRFEAEIVRVGGLAARLDAMETRIDAAGSLGASATRDVSALTQRIDGMAHARGELTGRIVALETAFTGVVASAARITAPADVLCGAINRHDPSLTCALSAATCERGTRHRAAIGTGWGRSPSDVRVGDASAAPAAPAAGEG